MLKLTIGRGNNRQTFDLPSGKEAKAMEKAHPVDFVKIKGAIMARIRQSGAI